MIKKGKKFHFLSFKQKNSIKEIKTINSNSDSKLYKIYVLYNSEFYAFWMYEALQSNIKK